MYIFYLYYMLNWKFFKTYLLSDRLLSESVTNFQSNQEEVSLIVTENQFILKNYTDDEPGKFAKLFFAIFLPLKIIICMS